MPNPACEIAPKVGVFKPTLEWKRDTWAVAPTSNQILMTPVVARLNDDNADGKVDNGDQPDVLFVTYSVAGGNYGPGVLRAMSGDGATELLNITNQSICGHSNLAVGDIDDDGRIEIIAVTVDRAIRAFEHDGTLKWTSKVYGDLFHCGGSPMLSDLNADGSPEIVAGRIILNADGSERGIGAYGDGRYVPAAADLNEDGKLEVIVGNAAYDDTGKTIYYNKLSDGFPGVADFTNDGKPEVVVAAVNTLRLQDAAGVVLWSKPVPGGYSGMPTVADFDGDGGPEIGIAGEDFYFVYDADGSILWQKSISESQPATGSVVFDFEGDGSAEVVYADEGHLWVLSGVDGKARLDYPRGSGTQYESPIVADLDGDDQVEIIVGNNQYSNPGAPKGIVVIGDLDKSWKPGRAIWNQFAYSITNIEDDGTIPTVTEPNWKNHNNYRSGDISLPDGTDTPDLTLEVPAPCTLECIDSKLVVWVHVGNLGSAELAEPAEVQLTGLAGGQVQTMATQPVILPLSAGAYTDALTFELDPTGLDSIELKVSTDAIECNAKNNTVVLPGPFCQI